MYLCFSFAENIRVSHTSQSLVVSEEGKVATYSKLQINQELEIDVTTQSACTPSDYERTFTVMVKDGTLKYGIKNTSAAGNWYLCKNVSLYMTGAPDLNDYYEAIEVNLGIANGYTGQKMGSTVSSNLNDAITGASGYESITVIETLESINQALIDANTAASASIADYANLQSAITAAPTNYAPLTTNASAYNAAITAAQTVYDNASVDDCTETINSLTTAMKTANVSDYTYVTNTYPYTVNLGTWTTENAVDRSSQHWDGTSTSKYSEQDVGWGNTKWSCSYSQDLALPAGKYVFKVAGRKSSEVVSLTLTVKQGDTPLGQLDNFPYGDTGKGIDESGAANFGDGDFAKNPNHANDDLEGCGWQCRFVEFELSDPATVNVAVTAGVENAQYQWVGFCNATVQTDNEDNVALMEALVALNNAKLAATLTKTDDNVGTGVFQRNETTNNSLWSAYETAKINAENYTLTSSSTTEEVNGLISALNTAISNYQNQPLNAPDAEKRYNVSIVDNGQDWDGNAITFIAGGREDMGGYTIQYLAPANANLNQALKFTAVEGEINTYKVSAINAETGTEQYITTGSTYDGGNNSQIRTTDDASKASWIKISATATNGQFQLLNVSDDNKVIARNADNPDNGMYTSGTANFTIAEASQASVNVTIANDVKWGTRIFPFNPSLDGVTFYSCSAVNGDILTLTEVEEPKADTPYILYAESGLESTDLSGWGVAGALTKTVGYLTGIYEATTATAGTYVLQNNNKVAFYEVESGNEPPIGAYRCYLTWPQAGARAFFFPENNATAIKTINALTSGKAEIFNASGVQIPALQKGMNIIRTADGKSQKVMVK